MLRTIATFRQKQSESGSTAVQGQPRCRLMRPATREISLIVKHFRSICDIINVCTWTPCFLIHIFVKNYVTIHCIDDVTRLGEFLVVIPCNPVWIAASWTGVESQVSASILNSICECLLPVPWLLFAIFQFVHVHVHVWRRTSWSKWSTRLIQVINTSQRPRLFHNLLKSVNRMLVLL